MGVRNYKQLSSFLKEIVSRLLSDQELCKLLLYNDSDPLGHADLTSVQIKTLLGKRIKFIPKVGPQETTQSTIVLVIPQGRRSGQNREILSLPIDIFVYTPFSDWVIKGDDLRIFLIMSRIQELLNEKNIDGVGLFYGEGFDTALITDELQGYRMEFTIDVLN